MTKTRNAENLRQNKSRISLIVEEIMAFASSTTLVGEIWLQISNQLHNDVLHYR